jgi:PIN domain nuclease of toxin-antitoxin system
MDYLLDTHTVIWFLRGDEQLPQSTKKMIFSENNRCCVSLASIWEIAIKISIGKFNYFDGGTIAFTNLIKTSKIEILPILTEHIFQVERLPLHHNDPFDRLIIAAAIEENLTIISRDSNFEPYPIECVW